MLLGLLLALASSAGCKSSSAPPPEPQRAPGAPAAAAAATQDQARARLIGTLVGRILETEHLRMRRLDDAISQQAFERYLEDLDPSKLFLLEGDVARLRKHALTMDDELRSGDLVMARAGAATFIQRVDAVAAMVDQILAKPLDLDNEEWVETDREKMQWSATEDDLRERWRQMLELEVIGRIVQMEEIAKAQAKVAAGATSGTKGGTGVASEDGANAIEDDQAPTAAKVEVPATLPERETKAREELASRYSARFARLKQLDDTDGIELFINAITTTFDPHTVYLPPVRKENFDIEMSGSLEGIGAVLSEDDHYVKVVEIVPGSASWRQGQLEAGDLILAVAQGKNNQEPVDVGDMRLDDVVRMVRGKKGTTVTLTVKKPDARVLVISIVRDVVEIAETYARGALLKSPSLRQPVGYIYLPSFYGNTRAHAGNTPQRNSAGDVRRLLGELSKRGAQALILDMRGNGGGLLGDAQEMAGLFIETGPIVQTIDASGEEDVLRDEDPRIEFSGQVVVLVDRFSASAAEIVAAALQDYGRAVIVGTAQTHGKGTVQMLLGLDELAGSRDTEALGVLKLTRQQFFRVNGASTQHRGVVPDIILPDPAAHVESGERYLDNSIPWSSVDGLEFSPWPTRTWDTAGLVQRSKQRLDKSELFAKVQKRSVRFEAMRQETREPLKLSAWRELRDREQAELEALDPGEDKGKPRFVVTAIDYDGELAKAAKRDSESKRPTEKRISWQESLARDAWVEEALAILGDMAGAGSKTATAKP